MKVLGFNFIKMHVERQQALAQRLSKNLNIDFTEITKENVDFVKAAAIYNIGFKYSVEYLDASAKKETKMGEVLLEGVLTISLEKEEDKDFSKTYKKKEMNNSLKEALFNFLLKKCTPRAVDIEDQINLPVHLPIPQVNFNWESKK